LCVKLKMRADDEDIIRQVLNGERSAYALLVDKYKDRVFSLALSIVRNRELAEEIAQDVFVKAYRSLDKFRKKAGFSTWIYRITYNTAVSETRKKKYKTYSIENMEQPDDDPDKKEEKEEQYRLLEKAVSALAPEEKLIITLYYFEEMKVEQISEITGLTVSNTKVKLFRIRNKLKEIIRRINKTEPVIY